MFMVSVLFKMGSVEFQHHDALSGAHRRTRLHANLAHHAGHRCEQGDFHLHRLQNHQHVTGLDTVAGLDLDLPEVAGNVAVDALWPLAAPLRHSGGSSLSKCAWPLASSVRARH